MTRRDRDGRLSLLVPACVAIITFVAFLPVLHDGFVSWDDDENFTQNPYFRGLGPAQLKWMWTTFHMGHYVPLSWMTLGLDYRLWGMNPAGYHLTNLLLHTASAVVVFFIARRLFERALASGSENGENAARPHIAFAERQTPFFIGTAAALAALLFAVHPLRVESVAWVTERRDVLSGLLYFSSILAYLRSRDVGRSRRGWWYGLALVLFAAALLSKATAMTLPAVLFILNVFPLRRIGGATPAGWWSDAARRVYLELVPFATLAAATGILSIVALHPPSQLGFGAKLAVSAYSLLLYAWKTIVPTGLSPLYEMPQRVDPAAPRYLAGYLFTIALVAAAWLGRRRWPSVTTALVLFVLVTLPMLGVVQNGPQIAADRYTYFAAPAIAMLAGAALLWGFRAWSVTFLTFGSAAIVLALAALTWTQSGVWHDSETLWSRVLAVDSSSSIAHSAMANVRYKQNRIDDGIEHSRRAIELDPGYAEAHNALGVGLERQGTLDDAIAEYRQAIALKPAYDDAENNLGIALANEGDPAAAINHYVRALEIDPGNSDAEVNWGNALVRLNRPDDAIAHYQAALRLRPDNAEAHHNWGVALARQGKFAQAVEQFQRTLEIDPGHAEARRYLEQATLLAKRQRAQP